MTELILGKQGAFHEFLRQIYREGDDRLLEIVPLSDFRTWYRQEVLERKVYVDSVCHELAVNVNSWSELVDWAVEFLPNASNFVVRPRRQPSDQNPPQR